MTGQHTPDNIGWPAALLAIVYMLGQFAVALFVLFLLGKCSGVI